MKEKLPDLNQLRADVLAGKKNKQELKAEEDRLEHVLSLYPKKEDFLALGDEEQAKVATDRGFANASELIDRYYTGVDVDLDALRGQLKDLDKKD